MAGEHEYAVPAMAPPDGFELFAARARALGTEIDGDRVEVVRGLLPGEKVVRTAP